MRDRWRCHNHATRTSARYHVLSLSAVVQRASRLLCYLHEWARASLAMSSSEGENFDFDDVSGSESDDYAPVKKVRPVDYVFPTRRSCEL